MLVDYINLLATGNLLLRQIQLFLTGLKVAKFVFVVCLGRTLFLKVILPKRINT